MLSLPKPTQLSLQAAGSNAHGQLATGSLDDAHVFTPCLFSRWPNSPGRLPIDTTSILSIASGANHTIALLAHTDRYGVTDRTLWGCGDGSRGQLGFSYQGSVRECEGTTSVFRPLSLPHLLPQNYTPQLIATSWETTYVVFSCPDESDMLISMGSNDFGNLGEPSRSPPATEVVVNFRHLVSITSTYIITALAAGPRHVTIHLTVTHRDGSIETLICGWGASRHGQLGDHRDNNGRNLPFLTKPHLLQVGPPASNVASFSVGSRHGIFLHEDGHLSGLGSNEKGQLAGITSLNNVTAVGCSWNNTYCLTKCDADGSVCLRAVGTYEKGQLGCFNAMTLGSMSSTTGPAFVDLPLLQAGEVGTVVLACGSEHVLLVLNTTRGDPNVRELWGWGWNEHGNFGIGVTQDVHLPRKIWPNQNVVSAWAACGTSWIVVNVEEVYATRPSV